MTEGTARIEGGFAEVGAGLWLLGRGQPSAFYGDAVRRRRKGWIVRDRARLDLVETTGAAKCADSLRPFLTYIPCAARISAVSDKVLVAPATLRTDSELVKAVPMSTKGALCVTVFGGPGEAAALAGPDGGEGASWVVMATASRTSRVAVEDGGTLSVRPDAVVAWTGPRPTGFVRRLGIWDAILPRAPRDLMFHFHGPCVVWIEGSSPQLSNFQAFRLTNLHRRIYGV